MPSVQVPYICMYALVDPRTDEVRYVGKTVCLKKRLAYHQRATGCSYRAKWIRSLQSEGLTFSVRVLGWAHDHNWQAEERRWIAFFRQSGARLTNGTAGGEVFLSGMGQGDLSERGRRARAQRKNGPMSQETRNKIAAAKRQHWADPAYRERVAAGYAHPDVIERTRRGAFMTHSIRKQKTLSRKRGS